MDHRPGPNIAKAAATVPNISQSVLSPSSVTICQVSLSATMIPAIGVHKPAINRVPAASKNTAGRVTLMGGGSLQSAKPARTTSTDPTTSRIRSNPEPGQPPANVEYRRRKDAPFHSTWLGSPLLAPGESPKRVRSPPFLGLEME